MIGDKEPGYIGKSFVGRIRVSDNKKGEIT